MRRMLLLSFLLGFLLSCGAPKVVQTPVPPAPPAAVSTDDGKIEVVFLHINDVYEIAPLENGKTGGMARVAALYKQLKQENPHTFFVHGGDFLSPSLMGTLRYNGEPIKGKQMVEVMNASGVQLVVFGNHEFDVKEAELQARLNESTFHWMGTTVRQRNADTGKSAPFYKMVMGEKKDCPDSFIMRVTDGDGTVARIGFFGLTIGSNPQAYVEYLDPLKTAARSASDLKEQTDLVIGLTHQALYDDKELARMLPFVPLIMGGHDHDNSIDTVGNTIIIKADANAKTAYVSRLSLNKNTGEIKLRCELVRINDALPSDPVVDAVVEKWSRIQDENILQVVDNPYEVIYRAETPLDGRESSVRNFQTNLGLMLAEAFQKASGNPNAAAFFNGGSIRIDDQLEGDITTYDIFRVLPFGGQVVEVVMTGALLVKMLDAGIQNKGTGGYLQRANLERNANDTQWLIGGLPVDPANIYRIATSDFLLTGKEARMDFFTPDNPEIRAVYKTGIDVRKAVADTPK